MMIKNIMATLFIWFSLAVMSYAAPQHPILKTVGVVVDVGSCRDHGSYCAISVKTVSGMYYGWTSGPVVAGQTVSRSSDDPGAVQWTNPIRKH